VTSGSDKAAELARDAWRASFGGPAKVSAPTTTQPGRKAKQRPNAAKSTSTARPEPATRSPAAPGAPGRAVLVLGGLAVLLVLLLGRRVRGRGGLGGRELAPLLAGLARGRGRRA
jgi:hypothetical protein